MEHDVPIGKCTHIEFGDESELPEGINKEMHQAIEEHTSPSRF